MIALLLFPTTLTLLALPSAVGTTEDASETLLQFLDSVMEYWPRGPLRFVFSAEDGDSSFDTLRSATARAGHLWRLVDVGDDLESLTEAVDYDPDEKGRVVIAVALTSPDARKFFVEGARNGSMEKGIWIIPKNLIDLNGIKSRFDSDIYAYGSLNASVALVTEVFSVKNTHRFTNEFANWTAEGGLAVPRPHVWERRQRFLRGVRLRNACLTWAPWVYVEENPDGTLNTTGLLVEAMSAIQNLVGFELEYYMVPDGNWGSPVDPADLTGDWNGMIGEVKELRADFAQMPFSITLERSVAITYGSAYEKDYFTFTMNRPKGASINYWVFVDIFDLNVWMTSAAVAALGAVLLFLSSSHEDGGAGGDFVAVMSDSVGTVTAVFLQRDSTMVRAGVPSRLANLVLCLCGFAFFSFYSGVLTSLMTATPVAVDIASFQDVLDKGYQPVVIGNAADTLTMQNSKPGTALHDIYYELMADKPWTHVTTQEELVETVKEDPKRLLFSVTTAVFGHEDALLSLKHLDEAIQDSMAPVYPRDSELVGLFDHHFSKLDESGTYHKLRLKWFGKGADDPSSSSSVADASVLGYDQLLFPVLVMVAGGAAALGIFFCEVGKRRTAGSQVASKTVFVKRLT